MSITTLPNGLRVQQAGLLRETRFLYREIFEEETYLQGGITLPPDPVVIDVGANIGLFTLQVAGRWPAARIVAMEPVPSTAQALRANVASHAAASDVRVICAGAADQARRATLTYYPRFTGVSTLHPEDTDALKAMMVSRLVGHPGDYGRLVSLAMLLLGPAKRPAVRLAVALLLRGRRQVIDVRPLSDVIDEHGLERIDLLKIDVEGAEIEVLGGIRPEHWPRIRQVAMEVHRLGRRLAAVEEVLEGRGFATQTAATETQRRVDTCTLYATRSGTWTRPTPARGG